MMHNTAIFVVGLDGLISTFTSSEFTDKMRTVKSKDAETDRIILILKIRTLRSRKVKI